TSTAKKSPPAGVIVPGGGAAPSNPPIVDGRTLTIQVPGRLLLGEDRFGKVDLTRLRWSVVVRDGGRCALLGDGAPTLRMAAAPPPTGSGAPSATPASSGSNVVAVAVAVIAVAA